MQRKSWVLSRLAIKEQFIRLFEQNQFTAARWSRQSGKSFTVAALLLWYATTHPNSAIGIVGPIWRQTKRILSTHRSFHPKACHRAIAFKPQRTQIHFTNGSTIEAFPNNPETIRGPTLHVVYADEFNFVANDQELYDAILYTLGTTDGKFVCTSTPWHTDSVFFKIFSHKDFADYKTSHVTVEQAIEPNGPLKPSIIQKIKTQMGDDPSTMATRNGGRVGRRRRRLANPEPNRPIHRHRSQLRRRPQRIQLRNHHEEANFLLGWIWRKPATTPPSPSSSGKTISCFLRHLKIFPQPTIYATVLGYLKALQDRWGRFETNPRGLYKGRSKLHR